MTGDKDLTVTALYELMPRPRKAKHAPAPWELPSLATKLVLICYLGHANNEGDSSHPALDKVARAAGGVSVRHVKRCRDELVAEGWLRFTGLAKLDRRTKKWERRPATLAELAAGRRGWVPVASVNLGKIEAAIEAHRAFRAHGQSWGATALAEASGSDDDGNSLQADRGHECGFHRGHESGDRGHESADRGHESPPTLQKPGVNVRQKEKNSIEEGSDGDTDGDGCELTLDLFDVAPEPSLPTEVAAAAPPWRSAPGLSSNEDPGRGAAGAQEADSGGGDPAARDPASEAWPEGIPRSTEEMGERVREAIAWRRGPERADQWMRCWWRDRDGQPCFEWRGSALVAFRSLNAEKLEEAVGRDWLVRRRISVRVAPPSPAARPVGAVRAQGPPARRWA